METSDKIYFTGLASLALGIIFSGFVDVFPKKIKRYDYISSGKTNQVLRLERELARDQIYVGDAQGSNFIVLRKYLESFKNKYDRKIRESEIKKLVEW